MERILIFIFLLASVLSGCKDDEKQPTSVLVNRIEVTRFPATWSGTSWDVFDGPDIFPKLDSWSGSTIRSENADASYNYSFFPSPSIQLNNVNASYIISLYDYDTTSDDELMGSIQFNLGNKISGLPSSFTVDAGAEVAFVLYVDYVY